jgi:hypothetical protein
VTGRRIGPLTITATPLGYTAALSGSDLPGIYNSVETCVAASRLPTATLMQLTSEATDEARTITLGDVQVAAMVAAAPPWALGTDPA